MSDQQVHDAQKRISRWSKAAVLISLCAFLYNPIREWLKEPSLTYNVGSHAWLLFDRGNLNLQLFVSASNVGSKAAQLEAVTAYLVKADNSEVQWKLPALNIIEAESFNHYGNPNFVAFTPLYVQPSTAFKSIFGCWSPRSKEDEQFIDSANTAIRNFRRGLDLVDDWDERILPVPLRSRIRQRFKAPMDKLSVGQYYLLVEFRRDAAIVDSQLFSLTVYEMDKTYHANSLDEYDYGRGFYRDFSKNAMTSSGHSLDRITDPTLVSRIQATIRD